MVSTQDTTQSSRPVIQGKEDFAAVVAHMSDLRWPHPEDCYWTDCFGRPKVVHPGTGTRFRVLEPLEYPTRGEDVGILPAGVYTIVNYVPSMFSHKLVAKDDSGVRHHFHVWMYHPCEWGSGKVYKPAESPHIDWRGAIPAEPKPRMG